MKKPIDMIGVEEKSWVVIDKDNPATKNTSNSVFWKCKCKICGNIKTFNGSEIRLHRIGDCKHKILDTKEKDVKRKEKDVKRKGRIKEETGNIYTYLEVESFAYSKDGFAYWNCKCKCGNSLVVRGNHLRTGAVKSCGCLNSYKEYEVEQLLKEQKIEYKKQYVFPDLIDKNNLRFDFALFKNSSLIGLVEYNGSQHYEEPCSFNAFGLLQTHDKMKADYCKNNNIPLLIINKNNPINEVIEWYNTLI